MCMVDDSDMAELWTESTQKARKQHRCGECGRSIEPGETYHKVFGLYERDPFTGKWCSHCNVAKDWLWGNCGGSILGAMIEDCADHVRDYRGEAACVPALHRICIGAHRKWRVQRGPHKGELMPIPRLPGELRPSPATV